LKRPTFLTFLLAAALAATSLAQSAAAQDLSWITNLGGWGGWGALEHANGDKVAIGRFNTLHVVWEDGGLIKYATSSDGIYWTTPEIVAPGLPASMPAISSDYNGTLAVAFVANPNAQGMGQIQYARKAWGASGWIQNQVVTSGTQPDIEARGGKVHLTWTTLNRVQYTSFPTTLPPAPMAFGEEIEVSSCPGTGFVRPSVTVVRESCKLVPKVAYLRYSDETTNPDPVCTAVATEVGPRVCARNPTSGTWSLEYTDLVSATLPAVGVEALSLSMNAQYSSGNTFLAWSDTSNGNARTRLAHGKSGTWNAITYDTVARHAHVAAKQSSLAGDYRLAWVKRDGPLPYVDWDASFRTGTWNAGAVPTWTEPVPTNIPASTGGATAGRPQATYWGRCSGGSYTTVEAVAEVEQVCGATRLMNHYTDGQSCPATTVLSLDPCIKYHLAFASASRLKFRVDTSEIGAPTRVGRNFVEITLGEGQKTSTVTFTWDRGVLVDSSENGFVLDNPKARVQVMAEEGTVELLQLADSFIYDDIRPGEQCPRN